MSQVQHRYLALLAALAVGLALLVAAPTAASAAETSNLDTMRAAVDSPGWMSVSQQSGRAITNCLADDPGDEIPFNQPNECDSEPRADIIEACANFGPTLSVTVTVNEPTDPAEDDGWQGGTFVGWFIDTEGDGEGDHFVEYHLNVEGELVGIVSALTEDGEVETCQGRPSYTGAYSVNGIDPETCLGGAEEVAVSAAMFYDTTPGEEGGVWFDSAPDDGGFDDAVESQERATDRYSGPTRIETAVAISQAQFPDGADTVYIARHDEFPDALAGGVLTGGPILLVASEGNLPPAVATEIARVDPDTVIALGGEVAVSQPVLDQAAAGRDQGRYAGPERIATSVAISQAQFPDGADEVYLARSDDFPDALAGGTLTDGPILLVNSEGPVSPAVLAEIDRVDPDRVIALGGTVAISEDSFAQAAAGRDSFRLRGPGRIETAIAISGYAFPGTADEVYLARADDFPDALAGGVLTEGPILLVPNVPPLPDVVGDEVSRVSPSTVIALGGQLAVPDEVLNQAAAY